MATGVAGNIDWACTSVGVSAAAGAAWRGRPGTLATKYAPTQCK